MNNGLIFIMNSEYQTPIQTVIKICVYKANIEEDSTMMSELWLWCQCDFILVFMFRQLKTGIENPSPRIKTRLREDHDV